MQNHKSIIAESPSFVGNSFTNWDFYLQIYRESGNSLTNLSLSFTNRDFRNTIGILGLPLSAELSGGTVDDSIVQ